MSEENTGQIMAELAEEENQVQRRRRRRRAVVLGLLSVLVVLLAVAAYLLPAQKPIYTLPVVRAVARGTPPTYLFSIYGVNEPFGVAVSPDGSRVYVTENGGDQLLKIFDREGRPIISVSPPDTRPGTRALTYATTDDAGNVYVVDRLSGAIFSFDTEGTPLKPILPAYDETSQNLKDEYPWTPLGITFTPGGFLVTNVAEGKHGVIGLDVTGKVLWAFGREGQELGQFEFPNQAIIDGKGRIFVSNSNLNYISIFDEKGTFIGAFGSGSAKENTQLPRGMVIDDVDRLYVVDAFDHNVKVFDIAADPPRYLFSFGRFGAMNGEFQYPNAIARDASGRLYITDRGNHRVQVWGY